MLCLEGTSRLRVAKRLLSSSSSSSSFIIYSLLCLQASPSSSARPSSSFSFPSLVLVLEELVATDGYRGDQRHELLEVALGVAVGVQALHHAVQRRLVFDVLQPGDRGGGHGG